MTGAEQVLAAKIASGEATTPAQLRKATIFTAETVEAILGGLERAGFVFSAPNGLRLTTAGQRALEVIPEPVW